jgi:glycosyltransferase involved in cell wall biosynthesis
MKVALVHDCIIHMGGAERVLQNLHAVFPDAPIYTLVQNGSVSQKLLPGAEIRSSFAQRLPGSARFFRAYFPLYPLAVESFDLAGFDVILSSSFAFAKGVLPPAGSCHICYCYSPLRYLWSEFHFHRNTVFRRGWMRWVMDPVLSWLRMWDRVSADRVDHFVAISAATAERIDKVYRRDSTIIYPPVRVKAIPLSKSSDNYFLVVTRLMAYKRVDLAIDAFNELGLPLKIVGVGPEESKLRARAGTNIEFLGAVSDSALAQCYAQCRALVFPGIEDFGIVMLEAQAHGKPVIACAGGGALEIVKHGETGVLFAEQTDASLADAVRDFEYRSFDSERIRCHALCFDESEFRDRIEQFVKEKYADATCRKAFAAYRGIEHRDKNGAASSGC